MRSNIPSSDVYDVSSHCSHDTSGITALMNFCSEGDATFQILVASRAWIRQGTFEIVSLKVL